MVSAERYMHAAAARLEIKAQQGGSGIFNPGWTSILPAMQAVVLALGDGVIDLMIRAGEFFTGPTKLVTMTAVRPKVLGVFVACVG